MEVSENIWCTYENFSYIQQYNCSVCVGPDILCWLARLKLIILNFKQYKWADMADILDCP